MCLKGSDDKHVCTELFDVITSYTTTTAPTNNINLTARWNFSTFLIFFMDDFSLSHVNIFINSRPICWIRTTKCDFLSLMTARKFPCELIPHIEKGSSKFVWNKRQTRWNFLPFSPHSYLVNFSFNYAQWHSVRFLFWCFLFEGINFIHILDWSGTSRHFPVWNLKFLTSSKASLKFF